MLPKINNKSFLECNEEDLKVLIKNEDYRENEYLDYKQDFSFLKISKGYERTNKILEFKSDICSFANSEGGYLIFGISDKNGCADELIGIDILNDNTDSFELERRNNLNGIYPRIPDVKFHFVKLQNGKYIVIICVKHDMFSPYTYIYEENKYLMVKRSGNKKILMTYEEIKNMFNQSLSLDKEIYNYRMERINYYRNQSETCYDIYSRFMILHIIPETFLDSSYSQNMYIINETKNMYLETIFANFKCCILQRPCADGLNCLPYPNSKHVECAIRNNGVVECFYPLDDTDLDIFKDKSYSGFLSIDLFWNMIEELYRTYVNKFKEFSQYKRIFICVSLVGCKGVETKTSELSFHQCRIDRNLVICSPTVLNDINDVDEVEISAKKLKIDLMLAMGINDDKELNELIKSVYKD